MPLGALVRKLAQHRGREFAAATAPVGEISQAKEWHLRGVGCHLADQ